MLILKNRAYLYDRIQVFQSRPQRYGTQLYTAGIFPVENKEMLNEERVKAKLPPLSAKQISQIRRLKIFPKSIIKIRNITVGEKKSRVAIICSVIIKKASGEFHQLPS